MTRPEPTSAGSHASPTSALTSDDAAADDGEPRLSVAAVARRLGVAPATLRTWDRRYGLGPSDHTIGRHRRYGPRDIARLELMQRALLRGASPAEAARYALTVPGPAPRAVPTLVGSLVGELAETSTTSETSPQPRGPAGGQARQPAADPGTSAFGPSTGPSAHGATGLPLLAGGEFEPSAAAVGGRGLRMPDASRLARGFGRAVLAMDSAAAQHLLADSLAERGVLATWTAVIAPVRQAISARWEHSGSGLEIEQLLRECVLAAMVRVTPIVSAPRNPRPVLLACMPGERQNLPLYPLSAALAGRGIGVRQLGAALPFEALVAAVRRTAPAAVVVWADVPRYADPMVFDVLPRTRQQLRVYVGGPGWQRCVVPASVERIDAIAAGVELIERAVAAVDPA
ncbi:MerR family transcriptional regulator [Solihabitans fulvus]|uniref:MerR family transcriptional regulator n=1 Tax=Solihabitans fulvus TaxID=1892852 RepID=UPI003F67C25D